MRRKTFTFLMFVFAILAKGSLMAQVSVQGNAELQERLSTVAKHKVEVQQTPTSTKDYCIPGANCSYGDGFDDFIFAGIENLGTGCSDPSGYYDYTSMQGSAEIGMSYTAGFKTGYSDQMVSMWVDFNDDEVFSEIERILTDFNLATAGNLIETEVTIPGGANPGIHRLRIGANWIDPSSPDPCAVFTYGEWEDYMIEITGTPIGYNVGIASVDMGAVILAGDVIPTATVANYGVETVSFPVTVTETSVGYSSTIQVTDLAYGEFLQLEFDVLSVGNGAYTLEFCTELDGDEVTDNDCMTHNFACTDQPRQKVVTEFFTGTW
jgi:hypothetical protein